MKETIKNVTVIICCFLCLYGTAFAFLGIGKQPMCSKEAEIMYDFIHRTAKPLEKKYNMRLVATGGGAIGGINLISFDFYRHDAPFDEMKARTFIIRCLHDILEAGNKDEKLRPFLRDYPLTPKNIDVVVYNHDSKTALIDIYPDISVFSAREGRISYSSIEGRERCAKYKTRKYETYEESIAILEKTQNPELPQQTVKNQVEEIGNGTVSKSKPK